MTIVKRGVDGDDPARQAVRRRNPPDTAPAGSEPGGGKVSGSAPELRPAPLGFVCEVVLVLGEERVKRQLFGSQDNGGIEVALEKITLDVAENQLGGPASIRRALRRSEERRVGDERRYG